MRLEQEVFGDYLERADLERAGGYGPVCPQCKNMAAHSTRRGMKQRRRYIELHAPPYCSDHCKNAAAEGIKPVSLAPLEVECGQCEAGVGMLCRRPNGTHLLPRLKKHNTLFHVIREAAVKFPRPRMAGDKPDLLQRSVSSCSDRAGWLAETSEGRQRQKLQEIKLTLREIANELARMGRYGESKDQDSGQQHAGRASVHEPRP